jgi:hypothetical protein
MLAKSQHINVNPDNGNQFVDTAAQSCARAVDALECDRVFGTLIEIVAFDSMKWMKIRKVGMWTNVE